MATAEEHCLYQDDSVSMNMSEIPIEGLTQLCGSTTATDRHKHFHFHKLIDKIT